VSSPTTRLRKLRAVPWRDRALLVAAVVMLAVTRVAVALVPFRVIARTLGLRQVGVSARTDAPCPDAARRVGWAVGMAAAHVPWQSTCLMQAIAGSMLLTGSGIESTVSFGVAKDGRAANDLLAHAWLRCGETIITGETEAGQFVELATFAHRRG
jgi:hypothetical protein